MTRRKQTDIIIPISNPPDLIRIESFDSIPHSRYFFNPIANDILIYMPISGQNKLFKPTVLTIKSHPTTPNASKNPSTNSSLTFSTHTANEPLLNLFSFSSVV